MAYPSSEGLACVEKDKKVEYIDKTGKEVIPCIYDIASEFSDGLSRGCIDRQWGSIDETRKEVIPLKYDYANSFSEGIAFVKFEGRWGQNKVAIIPTVMHSLNISTH